MRILYFAWLRHRLGKASEELELPEGVTTVRELGAWLGDRSPAFKEVWEAPGVIRIAVNQTHVPDDIAIGPDDEIAFFPPVTGG